MDTQIGPFKKLKISLQRGNRKGLSKLAPDCSALCGRYIGKGRPDNEKASRFLLQWDQWRLWKHYWYIQRISKRRKLQKKFGTRLKNPTKVEAVTSEPCTRNQRASSLSEQNKSALKTMTDHSSHDNHVTKWPAATILDRKSDKEAVHIQKEGWWSLNWDEGSYTLSHTYDQFLATSHLYRGKNRKNWTSFFWWSLVETEMSR